MSQAPAPGPLTSIDHALLRAVLAFGVEARDDFWDAFPPDRRSSLRWEAGCVEPIEPGMARERLRAEHEAQARPDLARVHVSWWVRALQDEPESVRRTVASRLPEGLAGALREGLGLDPDDARADRPAHPGAADVVMALWTARLVGDLPNRPDDPPAVAALTRFDSRAVARLLRTTGLAKWSLTDEPPPDLDEADRQRFAHFREWLPKVDPRFVEVTRRDIGGIAPAASRPVEAAGMASIARQLATAEPHRVRWALQHLPYPTARTLRSLMGPAGRKSPMLARWESELLRAAWVRLHEEGRLSEGWGFGP
jgi:hypothetical protein